MPTVSKLDPDLKQLIEQYYQSNEKMLPVIITGSSTSLSQSFLLALKRTLEEHELLDVIYPYYKRIFSEFDCYNSLYFLKEYPHPKFVTSHRVQTVANKYQSISNHRANYCLKFANKLFAYIDKIVPGCNQNDYSVSMFKDLVEQTIFYKQRLDETIKTICQIISGSDKKELLESIVSVPGVGHNTAARFIAEIMNFDRFNSHKALIAFTGTDPHIE
jgi:hypothetical protein